jgi:hypothetical protein
VTQPTVNIQEIDGALGVLPASSGRLLAFVGVADSGPKNTPATFAKVTALVNAFGGGPTVEAAAHAIERYGKPVVFVRTEDTVDGSYLDAVDAEDGAISAITKTGTGSATFTDNSSDPTVAADVIILFNVGGTQGTAGIVYQISLDGGQTWSVPHALGTANHIDVGATGASVSVSALGTVVAGDFISFTLTAPISASAGELVTDIGGSSDPTIDSGTFPNDDYEAYLEVVDAGTIGVTGITVRWSLDGGRTKSSKTALGTDAFFVFPGSGGVKVNFGAGTLETGDTLAFPTVAPQWNDDDLDAALAALGSTQINWGIGHVVGPVDVDAFDVIDLAFAGFRARGKRHAWIANTRMSVGDEDEATYLASLSAAFVDKSTTQGMLCAGADKLTSSVTGRKYRRPASFVLAARSGTVSEEIDIADVNLGALTGVSIRDSNGNPDEHDESNDPGLDDARFCVLRTVEGYPGVFCNRPRLFSNETSDFQIMPHRLVLDIAEDALQAYMMRRLNKPIVVSKDSGFILEEEALEIEAGANAILAAALLAKPKASAASLVLSRTDNLLSTKTLTGEARVVPLAYPETINLTVGYLNPALLTVAA